jgi:hypothetical protein
MFITYCVLAVVYSAMLIFSGITKLQPHPQAVQIIHELIGVPLELFPVLAALRVRRRSGIAGRYSLGPSGHSGRSRWGDLLRGRNDQSHAGERFRRARKSRFHACDGVGAPGKSQQDENTPSAPTREVRRFIHPVEPPKRGGRFGVPRSLPCPVISCRKPSLGFFVRSEHPYGHGCICGLGTHPGHTYITRAQVVIKAGLLDETRAQMMLRLCNGETPRPTLGSAPAIVEPEFHCATNLECQP